MSDERTWEHQDPRADADLIDPGPVADVNQADARRAQQALRKSTPEPIRRR